MISTLQAQQQHSVAKLESELCAMRAEITGLECVLGYVKVGSTMVRGTMHVLELA